MKYCKKINVIGILAIFLWLSFSLSKDLFGQAEQQVLSLSANWHLEWFPDRDSLNQKPKRVVVSLPSRWSEHKRIGLEGKGSAIYRRYLKLPQQEDIYGLYLTGVYSDYKIFVNDKPVSRRVLQHHDYDPKSIAEVYEFRGRGDTFIDILVENYHHPRGGIRHVPLLGPLEKVERLVFYNHVKDFTVFGILLFVGIYNLCLFAFNRQRPVMLWGGLLSLLFSFRIWIFHGYLASWFGNENSFYMRSFLNYFTAYGATCAYLMFLNKFVVLKSEWLFRAILTPIALLLTVVIVFPFDIYSQTISLFKPILFTLIFVYLYQFLKDVRKKDHAILWVFAGNVILLIFVIVEALNHTFFWFSAGTASYGIVGFIIANSLAISVRTQEITRQANLKKKIDDNLTTAHLVHSKMFDSKIPPDVAEVFSLFKPYESLGGDWFYQYYDEENDSIFITMGDVTGHGVASTLLTTSVLGVLYGDLRRRDVDNRIKLEAMMNQINSLVFQVGNKVHRWMTGIAICIDVENRKLHYINAGHPHPILVADGRISPLAENQHILGEKEFYTYTTSTYTYSESLKLAVFTDGISEIKTAEIRNPVRFMRNELKAGKRSKEVFQKVESFTSDNHVNDDLSLIILEISSESRKVDKKDRAV